jgi:Phage integrase, N-terminal SAM-like domain
MAKVLKRCDCPRAGWAKCPHSWTVRWWDGKQRERSFGKDWKSASVFSKTIEADKLNPGRAEKSSAPAEVAAVQPTMVQPVTLEAYAQTWLAGRSAPYNTARKYASIMRNHILPAFGNRQLADVASDREGVQALLRSLSPPLAASVLIVLRAMMTGAAEAGRIGTDRLRRLEAGEASPVKFTFPTHEQLTALAAEMGELGPAVWIMRGCGLRPSEMFAVRGKTEYPDGPGFSGGKLRVTEQRLGNGTFGPLKGRKAGDFRDVPVPDYVAAAVGEPGTGYLFPVSATSFRERFRDARHAAGLPGFRMHDLRPRVRLGRAEQRRAGPRRVPELIPEVRKTGGAGHVT